MGGFNTHEGHFYLYLHHIAQQNKYATRSVEKHDFLYQYDHKLPEYSTST